MKERRNQFGFFDSCGSCKGKGHVVLKDGTYSPILGCILCQARDPLLQARSIYCLSIGREVFVSVKKD